METRVVNVKTDAYDVYIGRGLNSPNQGYFGNPIKFGEKCQVCGQVHVDDEEGRKALVACYKRYFWDRIHRDQEFHERVIGLEGKTLGCFCKPHACHGDVIKDWLDADTPIRLPSMKIEDIARGVFLIDQTMPHIKTINPYILGRAADILRRNGVLVARSHWKVISSDKLHYYKVIYGDEPQATCECPFWQEHKICKHTLAVALYLLGHKLDDDNRNERLELVYDLVG